MGSNTTTRAMAPIMAAMLSGSQPVAIPRMQPVKSASKLERCVNNFGKKPSGTVCKVFPGGGVFVHGRTFAIMLINNNAINKKLTIWRTTIGNSFLEIGGRSIPADITLEDDKK